MNLTHFTFPLNVTRQCSIGIRGKCNRINGSKSYNVMYKTNQSTRVCRIVYHFSISATNKTFLWYIYVLCRYYTTLMVNLLKIDFDLHENNYDYKHRCELSKLKKKNVIMHTSFR